MAGYSGTPLVKKLGIKSGMNVRFVNDPPLFKRTLDLPPVLTINQASRKPLDFVLLFAESEKEISESVFAICDETKTFRHVVGGMAEEKFRGIHRSYIQQPSGNRTRRGPCRRKDLRCR